MAQALVRFLDNQYIELDGQESKFVRGVMGIFGHGNVTGLGEALENEQSDLPFVRGNNEQGLVHAAVAHAKHTNRLGIFACTSSIGPGATNMITGAATASINRLPVLLLPGDIFADRQPDPVLQQLEVPQDHGVTVNDCFKPVSRYWDRINRPQQLMTALLNGFRVLTDPAETGAVTICLPQDVQAEAWDYPLQFLSRRVWNVDRRSVPERAVEAAARTLESARRPLIIAGGGVHYSLASGDLIAFAEEFGIPIAETQAGKSAVPWTHPMSVGGIGVTGTLAANRLAQQADVVLVVGSRLTDFTTMSKSFFSFPAQQLLHLNVSSFDGHKMDATLLHGDARSGLRSLRLALTGYCTEPAYREEITQLKTDWDAEVDRLFSADPKSGVSQTAVLGRLNAFVEEDDVIVCAAGSLPGDLHRLWRSTKPRSYHLEYGYSCMGYEVAGALGVKLASPDQEVYSLVGDGSFLMLHSELVTSLQEGLKITVVILDNHGFQCIKSLQESAGSRGFGNELRYRDARSGALDGEHLPIDFVGYARSLGARAFQANTLEELDQALSMARAEKTSCVIAIEVLPDSMSGGYESWWRVGVGEVSREEKVTEAGRSMRERLGGTRKY